MTQTQTNPTKDASAPRLRRLSRMWVSGFKCFQATCDLEIGGLTLLCGRNSAGKSSFLQPALLLKQTYFAPVDSGPLQLDGQNIRFSRSSELFWHGRNRKASAKRFEVGFEFDGNQRTHVFELDPKGHIRLAAVRLRRGDRQIELVPGTVLKGEDAAAVLQLAGFEGAFPGGPELHVTRNRCDIELRPVADGRAFGYVNLGPDLAPRLGRWLHVPGLRGNPEREYALIRPGQSNVPGWFHLYTAGILQAWQEDSSDELQACANDLSQLDLTWKIEVQPISGSDTKVAIQVGRTRAGQQGGAGDVVSIADVGFGVSQVLPVVVALRAAKPGDVIHIEQPELHLHPEAQTAMGELLFEAGSRGLTVIAETHSMNLVRGVQTAAVRYGQQHPRKPPLVVAHWFSRDDDGAATVRSSKIGGDGQLGDWPEDLTKAAMDADLNFLEAALAVGSAPG